MPLAFLVAKTDSVALSRIDAVSTFFVGIVFGRPSSGKDEIGHIFGTKIGRGPPWNGAEFVGQVYIDVVEQIGYLGLTTGFAQRDWRRMTE